MRERKLKKEKKNTSNCVSAATDRQCRVTATVINPSKPATAPWWGRGVPGTLSPIFHWSKAGLRPWGWSQTHLSFYSSHALQSKLELTWELLGGASSCCKSQVQSASVQDGPWQSPSFSGVQNGTAHQPPQSTVLCCIHCSAPLVASPWRPVESPAVKVCLAVSSCPCHAVSLNSVRKRHLLPPSSSLKFL